MIPTICDECSSFLLESDGNPLIKNLPKVYDGFRRVKVRKQKTQNDFDAVFNDTFPKHIDLRQRSIFAYTKTSIMPSNEKTEPFYIFPVNGYKLLYSEEVSNSTQTYQEALNVLIRSVGDSASIEVLSELLLFNYKSTDLKNALQQKCEVIIYGIPYYYALRKSLVDNYKSFIYDGS